MSASRGYTFTESLNRLVGARLPLVMKQEYDQDTSVERC